jgi:hypothetical protein
MADHKDHKQKHAKKHDIDYEILTDIARAVKDNDAEQSEFERQKRKNALEEEEKDEKEDGKNTRILLIIMAVAFLAFVVPVIIMKLTAAHAARPLTIDELHQKNVQGDLDSAQGYVYNGFSFINFAGIWHSQVQKGNTLYDITFNYDPKSVENITVEGQLSERFNPAESENNTIYITFDPYAQGIKYIAVANAGLSLSLAKGFQYSLVAGCTRNESGICRQKGVITCDDKTKPVIYFSETAETKVILSDNCVIIQGYGPEIVRAKDRLLMRWYGIMQ